MKLQEFLNKISNTDFLLTVHGLCDELDFYNYEDLKEEAFWKDYKDRKIKRFSILMTNERPELCIYLV